MKRVFSVLLSIFIQTGQVHGRISSLETSAQVPLYTAEALSLRSTQLHRWKDHLVHVSSFWSSMMSMLQQTGDQELVAVDGPPLGMVKTYFESRGIKRRGGGDALSDDQMLDVILQNAEGTPAEDLINILGLHERIHISRGWQSDVVRRHSREDYEKRKKYKLRVFRIEIPKPAKSMKLKSKGSALLYQYLAPVTTFDLLCVGEGKNARLSAIYPVAYSWGWVIEDHPEWDPKAEADPGKSINFHYLDLSPYYAQLPDSISRDRGHAYQSAMIRFSADYEQMVSARSYYESVTRHASYSSDYVPRLQRFVRFYVDSPMAPHDDFSVAPYLRVAIRSEREVSVKQFSQEYWRVGLSGLPVGTRSYPADIPMTVQDKVIIFPVYPFVYPPGYQKYWEQDEAYHVAVAADARNLKQTTGALLVVGTGTGIDQWIAHAQSGRPVIYGLDRNPFAVANARATGKIAGYRSKSVVHDNLIDPEGKEVFPGQVFERIYCNAPFSGGFWAKRMTTRKLDPRYYWDGLNDFIDRFANGVVRKLDRVAGLSILWESIMGEADAALHNAGLLFTSEEVSFFNDQVGVFRIRHRPLESAA